MGAGTLLSGTSWQALSQVLPLVVNLTLTPYIIHGLGAGRYSVFLLVTSIATMLGQFDGGIGQSALRFFTINAGRGDAVATTRLLCTVTVVVAGFGLGVATVAFLFTGDILRFFKLAPGLVAEAEFLLRVLCALVGVLLLRNVFNSVLIAGLHFRLTAVAIIVGYVVYAVGLVLTVERGWGLYGIAATMVLQQIVGSTITLPRTFRLLDRHGVGWLSGPDAAAFFAYAWKVQLSGLAGMIQTQKDQLVAGRVLSAQESGPFGQGGNFAMQIRTLPLNAMAPIQAVIGAKVGKLGAHGALPAAQRLQRTWVRGITGWCVLGAPATFFGVRAWLPDSYADAAIVATILVASAVFPLSVVVLKVWTLSLGRPRVDVRASGVSLTVNFASSLALYPVLGMFGVVLGTALGQAASALSYTWMARRILPAAPPVFLRDVPWWQAALTLVVAVWVEAWLAPMLPRGVAGLLCAAGGAVPAALVFVGTTFRTQAVDLARARLGRRQRAAESRDAPESS